MNIFLEVFLEAAHRASIFPMASEAAIYAAKSFGNDVKPLVAHALVGGLVGHTFNYVLGRWVMRLPNSPVHHPAYQQLQHYFNRYGFVALVLCWLPLANILVVVAGMFATPPKKVFAMVILGLGYFYGQLLF